MQSVYAVENACMQYDGLHACNRRTCESMPELLSVSSINADTTLLTPILATNAIKGGTKPGVCGMG